MKEIYNPLHTKILLFLVNHRIPIIRQGWSILLGSDINCKLDETTKINHPYGIMIHRNTVIGKYVTIMHQVTIGQGKGENYNNTPIIGNHVFIGTGAKIFGKLTIEDGAKVGANAVVTKDVPAGATVVSINKIID